MTLPMKMIPETWQGDSFIAGGFAACPSLAGDVDVWVTAPVGYSLSDLRHDLLENLSENGFRFNAQDEPMERDFNNMVVPEYDVPYKALKVALVSGYMGVKFQRPYHIIACNADVDQVLAGFDVSTHQVALHPTRGTVRGPQWTPLHDMPVVIRDNVHTAGRMARITDRYAGHRAAHAVQNEQQSA